MPYFDIYESFGPNETVPVFTITVRNTDKYITWKENNTFYDSLSQTYYGNSLMGKIISMANREYVDENLIPDGTQIRIPMPFSEVQMEIMEKIKQYKQFL